MDNEKTHEKTDKPQPFPKTVGAVGADDTALRITALQLAQTPTTTDAGIVTRAEAFLKFLKGEPPPQS